MVAELARLELSAHVSLVEQCLLRPWPGNVRELLAELRVGGAGARIPRRACWAASRGDRRQRVLGDAATEEEPAKKVMPQTVDDEWRDRIEDALRANDGKVAAAARALGLHRNQLRRLIARHGIAVKADDD